MLSAAYQNTDVRLAQFEQTLNTLGYIPLVSTVSGSVRAAYGSAEATIGTAGAILKGAQYFVTSNREHRDEAAAFYWYATHGNMNISRGVIETIPLVGNLTTFLYDKGCRLRYNYTFEPLSPNTLPILEPKKPTIALV